MTTKQAVRYMKLEREILELDGAFPHYSSDPAANHELKLEMVRRGFEWALGSNRRGSDDARFFYAHIFDRAFNLLSEAESEQTEMAAFALAALAALKGAAK